MNTTTQKIRADLTARLRAAEQKQPKTVEEAMENGWLIGWLNRKIAFFESGIHRERDRANNAAKFPPVAFEREPDEHLL